MTLPSLLQDSEEEESDLEALNRKLIGSQPYVPVEFADFSVYNASLENREWFSSKVDLMNSRVLEKEVSRSPTASSITSGYFSHSASNATLSDMAVPASDSSDQLAAQTKDADSSEHYGPSLAHDFRPSSSKDSTELERGLVKEKITSVPLKENSALAKGSPLPQSIPEKNPQILCRTGSCSEQEACSGRNGQPAREFYPGEVTVEHTTKILEDHSFTEFMGVSDGKDFEGLTDPSAGELSSRRNLPNKTDQKSISDGPQDPAHLHSSAESDQVIHSRGRPLSSMSVRLPDGAPRPRGAPPGDTGGEGDCSAADREPGPPGSRLAHSAAQLAPWGWAPAPAGSEYNVRIQRLLAFLAGLWLDAE